MIASSLLLIKMEFGEKKKKSPSTFRLVWRLVLNLLVVVLEIRVIILFENSISCSGPLFCSHSSNKDAGDVLSACGYLQCGPDLLISFTQP